AAAQRLDEANDFAGERRRRLGAPHLDDGDLAFRRRIADPMIETAALQGVMHLAGAVGGDDDDRRLFSLDGAELGNGDLEIGEHFEKKGFESLIRTIKLVDKENRRYALW